MLEQVTGLAGALGGGALTVAFINSYLTSRREHRTDTRTQVRQATTGLRDALADVRAVVALTPPTGGIDARTVAETMTAWGKAFGRWERWLARKDRHLDRSISDAVSEHLGVVGLAHRLPHLADAEFADNLDTEWQEKATDYIDHVLAWLDNSNRDGRWVGHPCTFTDWLAQDAARQEDILLGYYTRTDRLLGRLFGGPELT